MHIHKLIQNIQWANKLIKHYVYDAIEHKNMR